MTKYLSFDLEIAKIIPEDATDWKALGPLGITCAAACASTGQQWLWFANDFGQFAPQMERGAVQEIVLTLCGLQAEGYTILTWNGLSFDFWLLAQESLMLDDCKVLARSHIDMMFHFFCSKGYPLGLDAAAKGMFLPGKPADIDGAKAPELWQAGHYGQVLDYVLSDARQTLDLAGAIERAGELSWIAKSGRPNTWSCQKWLSVQEAAKLPEPDTSWMADPMSRDDFSGWLSG